MRNMSFAMTTGQVQDESKDITRRFGWWFLKPGNRVRPVRKTMGLKKGEKIKPLLPPGRCIEIVSTKGEPLNHITRADCIREGFPDMSPRQFINMICLHYRRRLSRATVNRIEFKYIDEA